MNTYGIVAFCASLFAAQVFTGCVADCPATANGAQKYTKACEIDLDCDWCSVCADGMCVRPAACVYVPQCGNGSCSTDADCAPAPVTCSVDIPCNVREYTPPMICVGATAYAGGRCVIAPEDGGTCSTVLDPH